MKEPKIDQLFRQKLHQHRVAPTPAAWDKVAGQLSKRRRKRGGYYAAAAAVLMLLAAGWLWLAQQPGDPYLQQTPTVAVQENRPVQDLPRHTETPAQTADSEKAAEAEKTVAPGAAATGSSVAAHQQLASTESGSTQQKQRQQHQQKVASPAPAAALVEATPETALATALPQAPATDATFQDIQPKAIALPATEALIVQTEPVIIRYDASMAGAIAAKETTPEPVAPAEDADQGAEKVISILQKVKQGEIGLADIRQAKDKLLSGKFNKP